MSDTETLCLQCGGYGRMCKCVGPYVEVPARPPQAEVRQKVKDYLEHSVLKLPPSLEVDAERQALIELLGPVVEKYFQQLDAIKEAASRQAIMARHMAQVKPPGPILCSDCHKDPCACKVVRCNPLTATGLKVFAALLNDSTHPTQNNIVRKQERARSYQEELERALAFVKDPKTYYGEGE